MKLPTFFELTIPRILCAIVLGVIIGFVSIPAPIPVIVPVQIITPVPTPPPVVIVVPTPTPVVTDFKCNDTETCASAMLVSNVMMQLISTMYSMMVSWWFISFMFVYGFCVLWRGFGRDGDI